MNNKTRLIYLVSALIFVNFIYCQIDETAQDTTSGIIAILEYFGVKITEPLKALILLLIPILIRFFEKKNLDSTINEQEQILNIHGIEVKKKKTLFRKIWERVRYGKKNG